LKKGIFGIFPILLIVAVLVAGYFYRAKCKDIINKAYGFYYVMKGDDKLKKGNLEEAINNYESGLSFYPNHVEGWCNLGSIYVLYEDYETAVKKYKTGLQNTDFHFACRINLGIVLAEKFFDFDGAINQYEKVIDGKIPTFSIPYITPDKKTALKNQGLAYYNMGLAYRGKSILQHDNKILAKNYIAKSIDMYENAMDLLEGDYKVAYNLALAHHLLGNRQEAKKYYCKAIGFSPMNYESHYNLAILLKKEKKYKAALDEIEKAGLLVDTDENPFVSNYVFDVMNEITGIISIAPGGNEYLINRFETNFEKNNGVSYIGGKLVVSDKFDEAVLRNFQTCAIDDIG